MAVSSSPRFTAPTPAGVPVMISRRAPAGTGRRDRRSPRAPSRSAGSGRPAACVLPLTLSQIAPAFGWPISAAGTISPHGAEISNALPTLPRPAHLLRLALQVAARHVEADAHSRRRGRAPARPGCSRRPSRAHTTSSISWCTSLGRGRVGEVAAAGDDVVGVLLEEERRLLVRVVAHLDRVLGIVPPDAIDAADGKELRSSRGSAAR